MLAKDVFTAVSKQKRGGRKLLFSLISSPTCGMGRYHFCWWPTVRGIESSAVRLMESYVHNLNLEVSAEAEIEDMVAPIQNISDADASELLKKKIISDVSKSIKNRRKDIDKLNSFVITTEGGRDEIEIVISLNFCDWPNNVIR